MEVYVKRITMSDDELMHYGVKGMKWGVRRATKNLSRATTDAQRSKAVDSLYKHRAKATAEIEKLKGQRLKLDSDYARSTVKNAEKAAKLETKVAKLDGRIAKNAKKANRFYTSYDKAGELLADNISLKNKSDKLNAKAEKLNSKHNQIKAKIEANEAKIKAFEQGIKDIDNALIDEGKRRAMNMLDKERAEYNKNKNLQKLALDNAEHYNAEREKYASKGLEKTYGYEKKPYSVELLKKMAGNYVEYYEAVKSIDMTKDAYASGSMKLGKDYVLDRGNSIVVTESGKTKIYEISDRASEEAYNDNLEIFKKYFPD